MANIKSYFNSNKFLIELSQLDAKYFCFRVQ